MDQNKIRIFINKFYLISCVLHVNLKINMWRIYLTLTKPCSSILTRCISLNARWPSYTVNKSIIKSFLRIKWLQSTQVLANLHLSIYKVFKLKLHLWETFPNQYNVRFKTQNSNLGMCELCCKFVKAQDS